MDYRPWSIDNKNNTIFNTMYLAYSALRIDERTKETEKITDKETLLRYRAYLDTCNKHAHELAIIQQYLPGWMPKFK